MAVNYTVAPAKQQYIIVVEINGPIDKCFDAGSTEDALKYWAPNVKSVVYDHSRASEPYGAGADRVVTLNNGMTLVERIHESIRPTFIGYNIPSMGPGDKLIQNYQGTMVFEAIDKDHTRLVWTGFFNCNGFAKITEPLMRMVMKGMITKMANKLKKFVETQ